MWLKKRGVCYILFLCICLLLNGCMNKPVNMTIKLKKGDSYKVEVDRSEKITQSIKGGQLHIDSKIKVGYLCSVTNIDDNKNADMRVTFDTIEVKATTSNGQTSNNKQEGNAEQGSDNEKKDTDEQNDDKKQESAQQETPSNQKQLPDENKEALSQGMDKFSKIYTSLIGKSFDVKIGQYGKVKQVTGMDEIVSKIFTEMNIKDEKEKEDIKKAMKEQFGDDAITKRIERITAVYPNKDVTMGQDWQEKRDISTQFPVEAENKYSLKESSDGTSDISLEGELKEKEEAEPTVIDNIKVSYEDMKGTQKGNISINEETGMIKRAEIESKFSGKMKYTSDDPNMGSMIFPITVEEKTRVNVLRQ